MSVERTKKKKKSIFILFFSYSFTIYSTFFAKNIFYNNINKIILVLEESSCIFFCIKLYSHVSTYVSINIYIFINIKYLFRGIEFLYVLNVLHADFV